MNHATGELQLDRLRDAGPRVDDRHLRADHPAEKVGHLREREIRRRRRVDRNDAVSLSDSPILGRRVRKHTIDNEDSSRLLTNQHPGAAVTTARGAIEVF
jgi:hypothetical protein